MSRKEIEQEIELANMMVADLDKIFKKYAKAAQAASEARLESIRCKKYMGCENKQELIDLYGFGDLTRDEYYAGIEFFDGKETRKKQLSLIERHRKNIKDIRDRWKGTVIELQDELNELDGVKSGKPMSYLEQLERQERQERFEAMKL
jgi:hypothetical protein